MVSVSTVEVAAMKSDVKQLLRAARRAGWTFAYTGAGHWKATKPGRLEYLPSTPSDRRALVSMKKQLGL